MTEPLDHVVVGGGIVGLSTARHLLASRPGAECSCSTRRPTVGRAPDRPQQRRDPLRHLLRAGQPQGAAVPRGRAAAPRSTPREHGIPVRAHRQAARRHRRARAGRHARAARAGRRQRRRGRGHRRRRAAPPRAARRRPRLRCGCRAPGSPTTGASPGRWPATCAARAARCATGVRGHRDRRRPATRCGSRPTTRRRPGPARGLLRRRPGRPGRPAGRARRWTSRSCRSAGEYYDVVPASGPTWSPR